LYDRAKACIYANVAYFELKKKCVSSIFKKSVLKFWAALYVVRFTHCLEYLVVFNTYSSTLGTTRSWTLIVHNTRSWFLL
jgi:hypothetical protein